MGHHLWRHLDRRLHQRSRQLPLVGSILAVLPMATMAAPTMTTMRAPVGAFGSPLVGTSYGLPPTVL